MANNALKYYQNAIFHLEHIKNSYKSLIKAIVLPRSDPLSVIDIGCGSGRVFYEVLLPLLPRNVSEVIASDKDENMIEFCRRMNTDPKISFEILNIEDEKVPKHLENRFNLLFSSFCFSYVRNWRQAFMNCSNLLKKDGELLLITQFKTNALYTTYRRMSSMDRWNSYTRDYANYVAPLSSKDPDSELKELFKDVGMALLSHKFDHEFSLKMRKREVLDAYIALDLKVLDMPQDQKQAYVEDFLRIFSEETDIDFVDEKTLDNYIEFNFPTIHIHARNVKV